VSAPDFVAIGHVTLDTFDGVARPGGGALYAAIAAERAGLSAGILTSHGDDFPLDQVPSRIEVVGVASPTTTTFEHRETPAGRSLRAASLASPLTTSDVPEDWRDASLVLLAPVLGEVDPGLAAAFPEGTVAAAAQGWLRQAGPDGLVGPRAWAPEILLTRLQALFLSGEDVRGQEAFLTEWVQRVPIAVVTAGRTGALLFVNGERYEVRPRRAREVDATGAGDVFAATFLIAYRRDGDPWEAAEEATCAAALSVEGEGWSAVPDPAGLGAALAAYRRAD
jgi:sugar/nucleoside kinase (ribokinase family)